MNILILGAGPAGLTLGNRLKENGVDSFLILEREAEAGGLCRSTTMDGQAFDIGGPHFLDVCDETVVNYLFRFLPGSEWVLHNRNSKILMPDGVMPLEGQMINSPIEANIWQLSKEDQLDYLESISAAGCNTGAPMPEKYVDWITWKLGKKIAENYMLPYNAKLYGDNLDDMGTYWLYKLPNVSFRETLTSCLEGKPYGKQPCQTQFYYPMEYGYGEVWTRMAEEIKEHIQCNKKVSGINFDTRTVRAKDGEEYKADLIITTIPWVEFKTLEGMPDELIGKVSRLRTTSVEVRFVNEEMDTDGQWIYCADPRLPFHRATVWRNLNPAAHGMMLEARMERVEFYQNTYPARYAYINEYAYPVHTIEKPTIMNELLAFAKEKGVYATGRWGEHKQHNSDVAVRMALELADQLCK